MSSHRKKEQDSDSSSDSSDSSSEDERRNDHKKASKKHRHSSDRDSGKEAISKSKNARYSDGSLSYKKTKRTSSSEEKEVKLKSNDHGHNRKHSDQKDEYHSHRQNKARAQNDDDRYKKSYFKERTDYEDKNSQSRGGPSKDQRSSGRESNRHDSRDRHEERNRYNDRDRDDGDWNRNRRDDDRNFRSREGGGRQKRNDSGYRRGSSFDHANAKWGKPEDVKGDNAKKGPQDKEKPNFGLSGKLTEETNTYRGFVIKYSEPPEARKPRRRWRLYPFKGEKALQTLYIHRESAYLVGRERKIVDLPVDHPSCSKQHAALQYRLVPFTRENGSVGKRVRPYLIDLESANGTFINDKKIDPKKYYELFEKDVIKFGFSSREYVLLHENSKDEALDDDVKLEDEVKVEEEDEVKVKQET